MAAEDHELTCGFGTFFTKHVPHILEHIFLSLDYESYKSCTQVCQAWNQLLTSESYQAKFREEILKDEGHLHDASRDGNEEEVRRLLSTSLVNVNRVNRATTPLLGASMRGHKNVVQLLIDKGADPNVANYCGYTPLRMAASLGHKDVANLLLDRGADFNKGDADGNTALHHAALKGHIDLVQLLLDRGANHIDLVRRLTRILTLMRQIKRE